MQEEREFVGNEKGIKMRERKREGEQGRGGGGRKDKEMHWNGKNRGLAVGNG